MPYVFDFDHDHGVAPRSLASLLGGKGANLAEMAAVLRLPVPPGFTISTEACAAALDGSWPPGLDEEVEGALERLEAAYGRRRGDPADPMLVSVRSGAPVSMPGMMDTVLDLGLNDESVAGLAVQTDERFALDSYRRFIAMFASIVLDLEPAPFSALVDEAREEAGVATDADVPVASLETLVERFHELVLEGSGEPFPQESRAQLRAAIDAVFRSWTSDRAIAYRQREGIPEDLGTAVNVQAMVFGNRDDRSGTGVGFTRDPSTGEQGAYGDFLVNAQGEDVVAGIRHTEPLDAIGDRFPEVYSQLLDTFERLERHYRDMCDVELTIEQGRLWLLQTRIGKRTGAAAVRMAVDMVADDQIRLSQEEAVLRVTADHLDQVLHPQFEQRPGSTGLTTGLGASPGAAVGHVRLTADAAVEAADRGEPVILVRVETSPEDVHGMMVAEGVLTSRGGLVSHAAVVARGWGKPAVVGAEELEIGPDSFRVGDVMVAEGDVISIDGTSGHVVLGELELTAPEPPPELKTLLGWADEIRSGHLGVRANADTGADADTARGFGAEGIGLCRTEHMFLADDRLPVVRAMILADGPEAETDALERLRVAQQEDFVSILEAMDGLPVTVRLLDPPLHEFLPSTSELEVKAAMSGLNDEEEQLLDASRMWAEANPMIGTRGVRLAVLKPGLYAMQVRALLEAVRTRVEAGGNPVVEVMIPLTVTAPELALARSWVEDEVGASGLADEQGASISIGTMIETPRAALLAGELAAHADFFSFGTNDLTQLTFGFSRDDVEGRLLGAYLDQGLLPANPFETLDVEGVGELVRRAAEDGRAARPDLKLGVCGEHGGDPDSIAAFLRAGLQYVSCSPYRVPIARLAAAHAVLAVEAAERDGD
ncbi:MAG: pyruvate, phosphate dikinase [Acidimicrobiales bacterium]